MATSLSCLTNGCRDLVEVLISYSTKDKLHRKELIQMLKKGDIVYVRNRKVGKWNVKGNHLALIISNDKNNKCGQTYTVLLLSSHVKKANNKTNIPLKKDCEALSCELHKDSMVMINHITTVSKENIIRYISHLDTNSKKYKFIIKKLINYFND